MPMIRVNLSPVSACSATNLWQEGNDGVGTIIIAKTTTKATLHRVAQVVE